MTDDKITDITEAKKTHRLWACLICHTHWHGAKAKCPKCTSESVIEDQVHRVPDNHDVYTCRCNKNPYFKIARHPKWGVYFKCIMCGRKLQPKELNLEAI